MNLTGFFDQNTKSVDAQLEIFKQLDIKLLSFRYFNDQTLLHIDGVALKELPLKIKKDKLNIQIIDAMYEYHLLSVPRNELTLLFQNAETLGTKYLILNLPLIDSFDLQHDLLVEHLKSILEETKKKHFEVVFRMHRGFVVGQLAYLINEIKNIKFVLDTPLVHVLGSSVTTTYRILKNNTSIITIYDLDKDNQPYLLGFGNSGIIDVLKKAHRDKYKGLYLMDNNLIDYIQNRKDVYEQKRFLGLFSRNKKEKVHYEKIDQKLKITKETELSMLDMHKVYISLVKKVIDQKGE